MATSLKEYLKRYSSSDIHGAVVDDDFKGKSKKKKKRHQNLKQGVSNAGKGVVIVDDDAPWQKQRESEDEEEPVEEGDGPTIIEDIEVKRMHRMEALKSHRPHVSVALDGSGWVTIQGDVANTAAPRGVNTREFRADNSPSRSRDNHSSALSPQRGPHLSTDSRVTSLTKSDLEQNDSKDLSPSRQRRDSPDLPSRGNRYHSPVVAMGSNLALVDSSPPRTKLTGSSAASQRNGSQDYLPLRERLISPDLLPDIEGNITPLGNSKFPSPRHGQNDSRDFSLQQKRKDSQDFLSPQKRRDSQDFSPPRKRKDSRYLSPTQRRTDFQVLSPPPEQRDSHDLSPTRKKRESHDLSPLRKNRELHDLSPPRKRKDSGDFSCPRKTESHDLSPPRKRKDSGDFSPPQKRKDSSALAGRRDYRDQSSQNSALKWRAKADDISPTRRFNLPVGSPGRNKSPDISSPVEGRDSPSMPRRRHDSPDMSHSKKRKDSLNSSRRRLDSPDDEVPTRVAVSKDLSPSRKSKIASRKHQDLSPPRRKASGRLMADGASAGLQSEKQVALEVTKKRLAEAELLADLDPSISGQGAQTVFRDKKGRRLEGLEEMLRQQRGEAKHPEQPLEWGKGLAQRQEAAVGIAELEAEKSKPFARYRDDPELDKSLRERLRWGDPMAHLVQAKTVEPVLEDFGAREEMKASGFVVPQLIPNHSWLKRGTAPPPNRYDIRPGRHWDGVDRSTGFEQGLFKQRNEKTALEAEAYRWSVSDM